MVESPLQPGTAAAQATILVVDQLPYTRELLRDVLRPAGYRCLLAADGLEAMGVIRRERPDLVITGVKIPIITGVDLLRYLRENDPNIASIILTSETDPKVLVACYRLGAYNVIYKPVHIDALLIFVERALEHRQLLIERRRWLTGP